jgi:hypothetical protein
MRCEHRRIGATSRRQRLAREESAMHLQVRLNPTASPPDVDKLLGRLADAGVNLVAIGGSNVEFGGELAIVPEEGQERTTYDTLARFGYGYRVLEVGKDEGLTLCEVPNEVGALHRCLQSVAAENLKRGRIIRDILIGVADEKLKAQGLVPVHVYSEAVRTPAALSESSAS